MAILDIHVPYRALVVKRACRNESTETFVATIPVRVPELTAERAPVALRAVLPDGRVVVYRQINGALARPLALALGGRQVEVTADNAQRCFQAFREQIRFNARWPFLPEHLETSGWVMADGADVRRIVRSDREERLQAYREAFQYGSAFVDGQMFVPSLGPAWVVTNHPIPHVELHPERGHVPPGWTPRDLVFAHDQLAAAEARARECLENGRLRGLGDARLGETRGRVISHSDLAAGADSLPDEVAATASALLTLAAPSLPAMRPAAIHAYADLKAVTEAGVGPDAVESVLMTLRDLHDHWLAHHDGAPPVPGADPVADLLQRLAGPPDAPLPDLDLGALGPAR